MVVKLREFNNIMGQIEGAYHSAIVSTGLSDSEFDIFYTINSEGDGCNQSLIYKLSGQSKSTINSAIKKMEQKGLLILKQGDGRNTKVFLTEAGRELSKNTAEKIIQIENEAFSSWSPEEQKVFLELNRRFLELFIEKSSELR